MGLVSRLFEKKTAGFTLNAPAEGICVALHEVPDPTFGEEMMGKGIAIRPTGNCIVAPCDGRVDMVFRTGHAISLTTEIGADVLIHVGLDTVKLNGKYFTTCVNNGDTVKCGDKLIEFDREGIISEGYNMITPMVICNSENFDRIETVTGRDVQAGETVIRIR